MAPDIESATVRASVLCALVQVSMGVKHAKNPLYHGIAVAGAGVVMSLLFTRASLKRATQSWMSAWSTRPVVVLLGAVILGYRSEEKSMGLMVILLSLL